MIDPVAEEQKELDRLSDVLREKSKELNTIIEIKNHTGHIRLQ